VVERHDRVRKAKESIEHLLGFRQNLNQYGPLVTQQVLGTAVVRRERKHSLEAERREFEDILVDVEIEPIAGPEDEIGVMAGIV
jgi:hypothetical protein